MKNLFDNSVSQKKFTAKSKDIFYVPSMHRKGLCTKAISLKEYLSSSGSYIKPCALRLVPVV